MRERKLVKVCGVEVERGPRFLEIGEEFLRHFIDLCGLRPDERVLDVGCGYGRMAIPLTGYLDESGRYEGFDIDAERVRWCSEHITPHHPNFHFRLADISSQRFNPGGASAAASYRFPYEDSSFDLAFCAFVFLYLLPDDLERYLSEMARVLETGGRCLVTLLLLNDESLRLIAEGKSRRPFDHDCGSYRTTAPGHEETTVAYRESFVRGLLESHGLEIDAPIHYGRWAGREDGLSQEDLIIARKKGTGATAGRAASSGF